jgi:hypothetical protein
VFGMLFAFALTVILILVIINGGAWYWWLLAIGGISFTADTIRIYRTIDHLNTWIKIAPPLDKFRFYSLAFYGITMIVILISILIFGPSRIAALFGM